MRSETWINDYVFVVENFLSPTECDKFVRMSEEVGFEDALVMSAAGAVRAKDLRNNERVMLASEEIAMELWAIAEEFVPIEFEGRKAIGLNELLRFYRYDPGQQFDWHQDFPYERENGEQSFWTMLIYLNEDFAGGATAFNDSYSNEPFEDFLITPERGTALFFEHATHHKGEKVTAGRKYVLRTDVMYASDDDQTDLETDADDFLAEDWD